MRIHLINLDIPVMQRLEKIRAKTRTGAAGNRVTHHEALGCYNRDVNVSVFKALAMNDVTTTKSLYIRGMFIADMHIFTRKYEHF